MIDHAFADLGYELLTAGARVTNPASRRVLEKCGFQWTGVGLSRIRALASSAPIDRFRLDRGLWASLKSWGAANGWRDGRVGVDGVTGCRDMHRNRRCPQDNVFAVIAFG